MRILYGVQGTGNGHIARARAMAEAFKNNNIDVDFLFSGREESKYFSMECFGNYQTRSGLTFASENGKVSYLKTLRDNNFIQLSRDINQLNLSGYDLVISDFEPITAWAARKQHKTCIGLSHQNAFRFSVPRKGSTWIDSLIINRFAPSDHYIGLHWYHFEQPILPPIVHTSRYDVENKGFILVYLPFERLSHISELLFRFSNHKFICYHPDVDTQEFVDSIEFRPLDYQRFQHDLHSCSGVIANGGFELPSEAMSLGKKLLLKPLDGQFEQQSNVATLEMLGLATSMNHLDASAVRCWLDEQQADRVVYPDVAKAICEWVIQGNWDDQRELSKRLWRQVDFPNYAITGDMTIQTMTNL
ncbi:MJ1255/VC2487 family glycosyltransferase [Vibrio sp. RC27]